MHPSTSIQRYGTLETCLRLVGKRLVVCNTRDSWAALAVVQEGRPEVAQVDADAS
jgi:hypothetical protein